MAWIAGWGLSFIIFNVAVEVLQLSKVLHRSCPDRKGDGLLERFSRTQQGLLWHVWASSSKREFPCQKSWQEDVGTLLLEFFRYFGHEYRWGEGFKMKPALHALFPHPALLPCQEWYPPDSRYAICTSSWGRARSSDSNLKLCRSGGPRFTSH